MNKTIYISSAFLFTLGLSTVASACGFHGGMGPYQSRWSTEADQSYVDEQNSEDSSYTEVATKPKKKKPVFSQAASRASDIAKKRVLRTAQVDKKQKETPSEDKADRKPL